MKFIKLAAALLVCYLFLQISSPAFATGSTITITTPVAYKVFQRNSSNQSNISISGTYTGTPTSIEASWNNGAYTTITASPTGGTFSGTLANQTAGQGTLSVRFTNDNNVFATVNYIGIGDIFVVAGQSNASGKGFNLQTYSHSTLKASMFGNDDNWKELTDPIDIDTNQVDPVSDDHTSPGVYPRGSIWPDLATLYMADQNVPVAFIPASLSGVQMSEWQPNPSNHGDTTTLYGSMYRRILAAGGAKAVLFWEGESDAKFNTSQATFKSQLDNFANSVYSDFGIKVSTPVIGDFSTISGSGLDNIRLAQQQAWNDGNNVLIGPELYDINLSDESGDGLHFRSDNDLHTAANRWWESLKQLYYGGTKGRGPILTNAEYNYAKTEVTLTFTDETLPLLPAGGYGGFTVMDNGVSVAISSITKIASNKLLIALSAPASGNITVSLGQGRTGTGATVPTDSSTYNLPAEIFINKPTTLIPDTTSPTTPGLPTAGSSYTLDSTPTWSWSASADSESGLASYTVNWCQNSDFSQCSSNVNTSLTNSYTQNVALAVGTWYFRVKAKDNANNESPYSNAGSVVIQGNLDVTVNQASNQNDSTKNSSINFTVQFSSSVSDFTSSDITISGTAGAKTVQVSGSGTTYNVAVSGMTNSGTVVVSIDAGVATGLAGNTNSASTSVDNSVTYDINGPVGGFIKYINGYQRTTLIALNVNDGTDYSGVNSSTRALQRKSAPLNNGVCGTYNNYSAISVGGSYPNFTDNSVNTNNCYEYRYLVSDNLSNQTNYIPSGQIIIDTTIPTTPGKPISAAYTNLSKPTWTWSASTDTGSGLLADKTYMVQYCQDSSYPITCIDNVSDVKAPSYTQDTVLTEGKWYFRVRARDRAGNISAYSANGTIVIDRTAPTGSILINSGAAITTTRIINLKLSYVDASPVTMIISENADFSGAAYETYVATKSFTLSSTKGMKTVYIRFKDSAGNISKTYSDSIKYN